MTEFKLDPEPLQPYPFVLLPLRLSRDAGAQGHRLSELEGAMGCQGRVTRAVSPSIEVNRSGSFQHRCVPLTRISKVLAKWLGRRLLTSSMRQRQNFPPPRVRVHRWQLLASSS